MTAEQLRRAIEQMLEAQSDDRRLRDHLEGLSKDPTFPGLTWFWGPRLYARSRAHFRPFILNQFSDWITENNRWKRVLWADHAKDLDGWLDAARKARDSALVRKLLRWRFTKRDGWGLDQPRYFAALIEAYAGAPSPAARAIVLDEFNDWFQLDEATAIRLYEIERSSAKFILDHLPRNYWGEDKRVMWDKLAALARANGDENFHASVYRALIPIERWREEVLALAVSETDPARLNQVLLDRHPTGYRPGVGPTIIDLVEKRGRDVFPYVQEKLNDVVGGWGRDKEAKRLIDLAASRGWWDLWTATARTGPEQHFKKGVSSVLDDNALSEPVKRERLKALAGVSQEWNWPGLGLARVHSLDDNLAAKFYEKFPDLVRGPFRAHVTPRWWSQGYAKLVKLAEAADDTELMDTLAARYATHVSWEKLYGERYGQKQKKKADPLGDTAATLAKYYQAIRDRDEETFARRAAGVLTRIPAYSMHNYHGVMRHNDLARLLFTRSLKSFLVSPAAVQDLVEGSDIHVMMLAYRILALPDPRAVTLAHQNLDILLGTLLRPMHRKTRLAAFGALTNAARSSPEAAKRVLSRARDALKLPDKKYPKAELVGLMGTILQIAPELAGPREQPVIYRSAALDRSAA